MALLIGLGEVGWRLTSLLPAIATVLGWNPRRLKVGQLEPDSSSQKRESSENWRSRQPCSRPTPMMPAEPEGVVLGADSGCVLASAAATSARTPEACALGDACTERALSSMALTSSRCSRAQSSKQARRSLLAMPVHCCQAAAFSTRWATSACVGAVCALAVPASSARARAEE